MRLRTRERFLFPAAVVVMLAMWLAVGGDLGAAAAPRWPGCGSYCGPSRDCDAQCEIAVGEIFQIITCGDYEGGWQGGQCRGNSCDSVCNPGADCDTECLSEGNAITCGEYGSCQVCGDGVCATNIETRVNCSADCGDPYPLNCCGNQVCEPTCGEDYQSCSNDCNPPGSGGRCGDFVCDGTEGEDPDTCPVDCVTHIGYCDNCPQDYLCINNTCTIPAYIYTLPTCDVGSCQCGFTCVQTEYQDPWTHQPMMVCMPNWNVIFAPSDPCDYFPDRRVR